MMDLSDLIRGEASEDGERLWERVPTNFSAWGVRGGLTVSENFFLAHSAIKRVKGGVIGRKGKTVEKQAVFEGIRDRPTPVWNEDPLERRGGWIGGGGYSMGEIEGDDGKEDPDQV
jgi:hypothetical protein